jgi:hypothetical protein
MAVGRAADVELDPVGPEAQGPGEGLQRVFAPRAVAAAVGEDDNRRSGGTPRPAPPLVGYLVDDVSPLSLFLMMFQVL